MKTLFIINVQKWAQNGEGGVCLSIQVFDLGNHKCTMTLDTRGLHCNLKVNWVLIYDYIDRYTNLAHVLSQKFLLLRKVVTRYEADTHPIKAATFRWNSFKYVVM